MKIKWFYLVMFFYLLPNFCFCQTIEWKPTQLLSSKYYLPVAVAQDENSAYYISTVFAKKMFEKYDISTGKRIFSVEFNHPVYPKGKLLGILLTNNRLYVFIEEKDKKDECVFAYQLNIETGIPIDNSLKEVLRQKSNAWWLSMNRLIQSPDKEKILIANSVKNDYTFLVLDKDLNLLKTINEKREDDNYQGYGRFYVNNEGSVFCAEYSTVEMMTSGTNLQGHHYVNSSLVSKIYYFIITFDANNDYKKSKVNLRGLGIYNDFDEDFVTQINGKGHLTVSSFTVSSDHTFLAIGDISADGTAGKFRGWNGPVLKEALGISEKPKGAIEYFQIIEDKDGNRFIIAQMGELTYKGGKDFGDIYVIGLSNELKLLWKKSIKLNQRMIKNTGVEQRFQLVYYSFFTFLKNNKLVVMYNDNVLNKTNPNPADNKYKDSDNGIIVLNSFDSITGDVERIVIDNQNSDDMQFTPGSCSGNKVNEKAVLFNKSNDYISLGLLK